MIQQQDMSVWLEWTSPVHLTGIIFQKERRELTTEFESMVQWIAKNLKFTITIAVSRALPNLQDVCLSYEEACTLLHFKAVLGNNRIIRYSDVEHQRQKFEHEYLRTIHEISLAFRSGDEAWKSHYDRFFEDLREDKSSKTEIIKLINYMLADLELHLSSGSKEEIQIVRQAVREVHHHLDTFDMLEELSGEIYDELIHCSQQLQDIRSSRNNYHLLQEIKEFIEQEYANPDLSLDYLSDKFSINTKYLSRLFKESFCENFLDFLMCVRIRVAKDLLANHAITIQEVGEKVGYPNAATFRRVFRKIEGISPQDYRSRGGL
jgi:two-component system, response regulator YesN